MEDEVKCELCGEPLSPEESMFRFHGYFGPCPKPPLPRTKPFPERVEDKARKVYAAWKEYKSTGNAGLLVESMDELGALLNMN